MAAFVVMDRNEAEAGANATFVRDGFSVIALIAPVIWLLWHRLWIEAFVALAAAAGLAALGTVAGFENTAPLLSFLVSVFVALEGPQLRVAALERRGLHHAATVEADNAADAELKYFARAPATAAGRPVVPPGRPALPAPVMRPAAMSGPALGLLDYPGAR
ncbi:MAG: DUF2628 domain-containing protein [Rhizobiaceae bacterium]